MEPEQGRVSHPWCKKGFEAAALPLFAAAVQYAKGRGLTRLFAAYRRDWEPVLQFFADAGFAKARDVVNYYADPVDLPTVANRGGLPLRRLQIVRPRRLPELALRLEHVDRRLASAELTGDLADAERRRLDSVRKLGAQ